MVLAAIVIPTVLPGAWYYVAPLSIALIVINLAYIVSTRTVVRSLKESFEAYREGSQRVFNAMAHAARQQSVDQTDIRLARIESQLDSVLHPDGKGDE